MKKTIIDTAKTLSDLLRANGADLYDTITPDDIYVLSDTYEALSTFLLDEESQQREDYLNNLEEEGEDK